MINAFTKAERLNSKRVIDALFTGSNRSMAVYPLRAVYMTIPRSDTPESMGNVPVSILISVPKKRLHHAVDRNRMKRQVREAYRTQKHQLWNALADKDYSIAIAFICITDKPSATAQIQKSVGKLLKRIEEKVSS